MSEFGKIAERIAGHAIDASTRGGIRTNEIAGIINDLEDGEEFNCYPGVPGSVCHRFAAFVSLTSKEHKAKQQGHLTCRKAIEKLIQHMQGSCADVTREAVLIVDSWDVHAVSDWRSNLERIEREKYLEIYLISGGRINQLRL